MFLETGVNDVHVEPFDVDGPYLLPSWNASCQSGPASVEIVGFQGPTAPTTKFEIETAPTTIY